MNSEIKFKVQDKLIVHADMLNQTKKECIEKLNQNVKEDNLNKENADFLEKLIGKSDSIEEALAIMALGTTYKKVGLNFNYQKEPVFSNVKYLKKNDALSFETDKTALTHKLIIGDNYDSLKQLLTTQRGKVDIIYIDPPYGKDNSGKCADTNYSNAITRDNLLSMLYPRLQLAKELLKDSGVIFCSIDDKNQAYMKCLFDEVFDERNFYGTLIQLKGNTQNDAKTIQKNHEYILCYVKNYRNNLVLSYDNVVKEKVYEDNYILGRDTGSSSGHDKLIERLNLGYTIYYMESTLNGETGNHNKLIERPNLGYTIYDIERTVGAAGNHDKLIEQAANLNKKYGDFKYYISKDGKTFIHAIAIADYDKASVQEDSTEEEIYTDVQELIDLGYEKIRPPKRKGEKLGRWTWGLETFKKYWNNDEVLIKKGTKEEKLESHDKLVEKPNLGYTIYVIKNTIGAAGNHNKLIEQADNLNKKYGDFKYYISKDGKTFIHAIAIADYEKASIQEDSTEEEIYTDVQELINLGYKKIRPPKRKGGKLGCWTWGIETFKKYWNNNGVLLKKGRKKINVIRKVFLDEKDIIMIDGNKYNFKHNTLPLQSVIDINNSNGTTLLSGNNGIIPGCAFSNPKNPDMLKFLFKAYDNKDSLILDFFAGSGTTGQAVLDLNKEDGGSRKFILCTNNEITDSTPNGIAYDVTSKRLKRIMTGCCYDASTNFGWIDKNAPYGDNLEVTEITDVPVAALQEINTPLNIVDKDCETLSA